MKFIKHTILNSDIIVYDCEYNNEKFRIANKTDLGGNIWILKKYHNKLNEYYDTNISSSGTLTNFIKHVSSMFKNKII